jgi:hypothetical protein
MFTYWTDKEGEGFALTGFSESLIDAMVLRTDVREPKKQRLISSDTSLVLTIEFVCGDV